MPMFWENPWLQFNNIGFLSIVTLWLLRMNFSNYQNRQKPFMQYWNLLQNLNEIGSLVLK